MKISPINSQGFIRSMKWVTGLFILSLLVFQQIASTQSIPTGGVALPDLTIDADRLAASIDFKTQSFRPSDCALSTEDRCVSASGKRTLLRFDVAIPNIGDADFFLGDPVGNPLFVFSPCHHHYHLDGFASYRLLDANQSVVVTGRKQAFCLEDFAQYSSSAGSAKYTCTYQGISTGWEDIYGKYLDCQWLDVTGVPDGNYFLQVEVNVNRKPQESNYNNNIATVPVRIGKGRPR